MLNKDAPVFFCGIGGSGMISLALILSAQGYDVCGSDRAYDQGQNLEKFQMLKDSGVRIFPQNGEGVSGAGLLVVSSAIEDSIPDVGAAKSQGVLIAKRAEVLSEVFHASNCSIGVSGTSGKTTVTGMLATILQECNLKPTVMNGGRVKNLEDKNQAKFGSLLVGTDDYFVSEMDESDGSIELFSPDISVLNNIALDHTSLDQLISYFQSFIDRCGRFCVLNMDNFYVRALKPSSNTMSYAIEQENVDLKASNLVSRVDGVCFDVNGHAVSLAVPGMHNVSNALAALCVAHGLGIDLKEAIAGLEQFTGIKRRLETLGVSDSGVTVIDDFGHNPDKIAASLATLKEFDGRLIVMFQPHGFAPLRMMGQEMADVFGKHLSKEDILCIPEVYYAGGTVDRSVTAKDFVKMIEQKGASVHWFETRDDISPFIRGEMKSGDRIVVMGARDDTLTLFAESFL